MARGGKRWEDRRRNRKNEQLTEKQEQKNKQKREKKEQKNEQRREKWEQKKELKRVKRVQKQAEVRGKEEKKPAEERGKEQKIDTPQSSFGWLWANCTGDCHRGSSHKDLLNGVALWPPFSRPLGEREVLGGGRRKRRKEGNGIKREEGSLK
ncbi:hypothetical protein NDU88_005591 [Pleurodeles waltl]|uniref:Uncharacterized protein n=1 Tax=Pleurodeles waltl TaxID=8319 RepID=A0AAV7W9Z8_PLEWA|nr:hypothetical protein NDU88_005591 [Pleurodeles waltl]